MPNFHSESTKFSAWLQKCWAFCDEIVSGKDKSLYRNEFGLVFFRFLSFFSFHILFEFISFLCSGFVSNRLRHGHSLEKWFLFFLISPQSPAFLPFTRQKNVIHLLKYFVTKIFKSNAHNKSINTIAQCESHTRTSATFGLLIIEK